MAVYKANVLEDVQSFLGPQEIDLAERLQQAIDGAEVSDDQVEVFLTSEQKARVDQIIRVEQLAR